MNGQRAILFDLDGTLVHTSPDLWCALNDVLKKRGMPTIAHETVEDFVGGGARVLLARTFFGPDALPPEIGMDPDFEGAVSDFLSYYSEHLTEYSHPYRYVPEWLTIWRQQGFKLAVVTNKPERLSRRLLTGLRLNDLFDILVGGDTLPQRKPAPEPLLYALDKMNVSIEQAVMVGDSDMDVQAARAAGCSVIAVSYGYNRKQPVSELLPDGVVDCFSHLNHLLRSRVWTF